MHYAKIIHRHLDLNYVARRNLRHKEALTRQLDSLQEMDVRAGKIGRHDTRGAGIDLRPGQPTRHYYTAHRRDIFVTTLSTPSARRRARRVAP